MKMSKQVEKKLKRYIEKCSEADPDYFAIKLKLIEQIMELPKKAVLLLLNKLEEQDDYIASLERAEREPCPIADDYKENLQHNLDTGWFYPDNDH